MSMSMESERPFTVTIEASAVVYIDVTCCAIDAEAAQMHVEDEIEEYQDIVQEIVENLMNVDSNALKGFLEEIKKRTGNDTVKLPLDITAARVTYHQDDALEVCGAEES